ncbi:MAG: hypothetical protein LBF93_06355 [Zoogloeaceae bacterium]|jgi:hypothetical protein|nr:hypothetical protein [Zoogloeaceae bacterium]
MKKSLRLKIALLSFVDKSIERINRMLAPKFSLEQAEDSFRSVVSALNETPMKGRYWLCGGGVLGYARCGSFLSHDSDIDFHYWAEDETLFCQVTRDLGNLGLEQVLTYINNDGKPIVHKFSHKGIGIDFFPCWRDNGFIYWMSNISRHRSRPARQFLSRVPDQQMKEVEFLGVPVFMPKDTDQYLTSLYGDWRIPMPDYCYWIDSKAIISCDPWRHST